MCPTSTKRNYPRTFIILNDCLHTILYPVSSPMELYPFKSILKYAERIILLYYIEEGTDY